MWRVLNNQAHSRMGGGRQKKNLSYTSYLYSCEFFRLNGANFSDCSYTLPRYSPVHMLQLSYGDGAWLDRDKERLERCGHATPC